MEAILPHESVINLVTETSLQCWKWLLKKSALISGCCACSLPQPFIWGDKRSVRMKTGDNISAKHRSSVHLHKLNPATNVKSKSAPPLTVQSTSLMSESQPGGPPECTCERLRGEMWLSWRDCVGSPLAAALGCGGCEQIIPSSAERSKHQTHRGGVDYPNRER